MRRKSLFGENASGCPFSKSPVRSTIAFLRDSRHLIEELESSSMGKLLGCSSIDLMSLGGPTSLSNQEQIEALLSPISHSTRLNEDDDYYHVSSDGIDGVSGDEYRGLYPSYYHFSTSEDDYHDYHQRLDDMMCSNDYYEYDYDDF